MPIIDQVLEGAALLARQASSTVATAVTSAATGTTGAIASAPTNTASLPGASGAPATTTNPAPAGTSGPPPSATTTSGGGGGGGGGGSSPLLFFVALGFGVVFTNLWIIVGVKYCFRYNARARQLRLAAEDGEPINLENIPHPRRRRREKKLMTIDEVNEKFPMLKYKTWVATRAEEGLPTTGGIDAPSRANSVRSAEGVIASVDETERRKRRASTDEPEDSNDKERPPTSIAEAGTSVHDSTTADGAAAAAASATTDAAPGAPSTSTAPKSTTMDITRASLASADGDVGLGVYNKDSLPEHYNHSDDEDDEHIDSALPPECVGTSGDTCAICIDTLEDDDDVRGLTCGHAFHAVCLDPWLTSRRACCPLCKADYYTPKPRAPPAEGADAANAQGAAAAAAVTADRNRANMQARPGTSWRSAILPSRFMPGSRNANAQDAERVPPQRETNEPNTNASANANAVPAAAASEVQPLPEQPAPTHGGWLRSFRRRNGESSQEQVPAAAAGNAAEPAAPAAEVTPSQLEAGVRAQ
ncbi:ring finger domain protein [Sporothrix brasiliensis 5110]|uniref:Ring finger domain protein n=1 Tax=Sporothrix brasiliensis 5110 TaxID=1398154 RepID=A0A0C2IYU2_9PEZI|nr:ring finger domain protein [Sporothrix brasiliensis 5110]KIH91885.1 ring finger domain protein [Sporothrix brasiliensis 5110]